MERKGNYIDGNGLQIDFEMMLETIQKAHMDKRNELVELLGKTWVTDTYRKNRYHHHTRGERIAQLANDFARISLMLYHLQHLQHSKPKQDNFNWWFTERHYCRIQQGDEEE